jgi:SAM-dependent methyltransferase
VDYFEKGIDAERYSRARPHIHTSVVEKFRSFASLDAPLARALDVGCGTGQSTVALTAVADSVVGVDSSPEMLTHVLSHPGVRYVRAKAERLPFADNRFDVIAAGLAFHWFKPDSFMAEARRLLRGSGWLVIYTTAFTGEMLEEADFVGWFRGDFLSRYPTPDRGRVAVTATLAQANGLAFRGEEPFSNDVEMSLDRFVDYELSTTNIIASVERGESSFEDANTWMHRSLAPMFGTRNRGTFRFSGTTSYLQKQA